MSATDCRRDRSDVFISLATRLSVATCRLGHPRTVWQQQWEWARWRGRRASDRRAASPNVTQLLIIMFVPGGVLSRGGRAGPFIR